MISTGWNLGTGLGKISSAIKAVADIKRDNAAEIPYYMVFRYNNMMQLYPVTIPQDRKITEIYLSKYF